MHNFKKTSLALAVAASALPLSAQETEKPSEFSGEQIFVTASRSALERVNVGSSVSVITRADIEHRQARYVTDMLRSVPGFAVSQSGVAGSQTQVRVRGAESNHVLVLIDGVRANDPASGDDFRWEFLSTSNVERIEIVRGPQSSLWGSEAVAAVVHVITRDGAEANQLGGYAEGGSNSTLNGGLNGSVGSDRWSLGFGVEQLDTDGSNISRTGDENDDSDMLTGSLTARFAATDNLSLFANVRAVDAYSQFDPTDFFVTGLPTDGDVATDTEQLFSSLGGSLSTLDGRLVHSLRANFIDTSNDNLVDGVVGSSTSSERRTLAYQADISVRERDVLSVALEQEETDFSQRGDATFGDPNQDQSIDVTSVIADYQWHAGDQLTMLVSGRFDSNSDFDDAVTGRIAAAWDVAYSTQLRASVGTGQKNPTFTERFGFFPEQFIGNPDLKPETSTSFEVGIGQGFLDDSLKVDLAVFHQDLEDEIDGFVFDADSGLFTADNKDGSSTRTGAEISASYFLADNIELRGSYTYTDAKEDDATGAEVPELRRPKHLGSLAVDTRFYRDRLNILLVGDYSGSRQDIFFPPFPEPSEIVELDSYWLLDLTVGFDITDSVNVYGRVQNLLDEDYEEVYGYQTLGRTAYAGIRVNFGN